MYLIYFATLFLFFAMKTWPFSKDSYNSLMYFLRLNILLHLYTVAQLTYNTILKDVTSFTLSSDAQNRP